MKKHIPNTLTLFNVLLGCLGIFFVFNGQLLYASYAIWFAAVFDFLDGFTARLLNVSSPIGKELDSLADMVTFGVLPSFILLKMIENSPFNWIQFIPLVVAAFSALRLAKFNIDTTQSHSFRGVPTPAVAFFVSGLPFWQQSNPSLITWHGLVALSIILAGLLVAPAKMLALKFKTYQFGENWARYLVVIIGVALFIWLGPRSFPLTIGVYILISLVAGQKEQ